jgi:hypothetical protein
MDLGKVIGAVGGGLLGGYIGDWSPISIGLGAGGGRYLGGVAQGEESSNNLTNSLMTGLAGYGLGSLGENYAGMIPGNDWSGNFASMGGDAAAPAATASASKGLLGGLSGGSYGNILPALMATGLMSTAASAPAKQKQEEDYLSNLQSTLQGATWNDTTRAGLMKGLSGQYGTAIAGAQRRAANAGAESGRGGGFYGSATNRAQQAAREAVAKSLATTYQPYGTDYAQLAAKANTGVLPWYTTVADQMGTIAGQLTPYAYLAGSGLLRG